ncbi:uncharacterized protein [Parasteatoda tepidariorum]|uniref:uncharacterized protein n=1 Tax=Parasteatoda tepidariorum TaxID=114398 RepID=UPI00077F9552|nr:endocuticle structural glycoprotein SgAbd-8-like [Parasteatoda tepidariorum]
MIAFITVLALAASVTAQYPYQQQGHQQGYQAQQSYQPQPSQHQAPAYQPQSYQPQPQSYQPQPQSYQPQQPAHQPQPQYHAPSTQARTVAPPAAVHYVNIGAELAGDYKFGYDTGKGQDQSFREETRLPDGSVKGAYGYVDETGKQRIIRYTAGKDGYKVEGDGIPKAPPAPAHAAPAQAAPAQQGYGGAYGDNQQYGAGSYH